MHIVIRGARATDHFPLRGYDAITQLSQRPCRACARGADLSAWRICGRQQQLFGVGCEGAQVFPELPQGGSLQFAGLINLHSGSRSDPS